MLPVLSNPRRFGLYLAAWTPIPAFLVVVMAVPGNLGWAEAAAVLFPLCELYAFICLSPWYVCRRLPLEKTRLASVLTTYFIAALIEAGVFAALASGLAALWSPVFPGIEKRVSGQLPLIFAAGLLLYLVAVAFHYIMVAFENSRQAETREIEARLLAGEAELRALKAQVNPHFLFNSLHSISALTTSDPGGAREMCILLSDFLRKTLGLGDKATIPLAEELSLVRAYLAVEKVRFGARLSVQEQVDAGCAAMSVPPLLLQPLVENAVVHGIANMPEGGWIRIEAHCQGGHLRILVENSIDAECPPKRRNGIGLVNVRRRLDARYGTRAGFSAKAAGETFRAAIAVPVETEVKTA